MTGNGKDVWKWPMLGHAPGLTCEVGSGCDAVEWYGVEMLIGPSLVTYGKMLIL